jgi:taurine--2-oxoglutarate transaminase
MVDKYPFVGETRGVGLFLAIELVLDKNSREPLPKHVVHRVFMEFVKRGLLTMAYDARFRIQTAMNIDTATIDEAVGVITEVFDDMKKSGWWRQ